jgi:nitrogen fixation NifU-like protein
VYSAKLLQHFEHPRHSGELPDADVRVRRENPVCGDILELSAKIFGGHISEIRFLAKGCVPTIACASALCSLVNGKEVTLAAKCSRDVLINELDGVPSASEHAVQLVLETLRQLLASH